MRDGVVPCTLNGSTWKECGVDVRSIHILGSIGMIRKYISELELPLHVYVCRF